MSVADGNERRVAARAPIELKVEYQKLNTFFADYTRNICKGGTFIKTRKPLDVGTEFVFTLTVPKLREPLSIRGQVQWVKREDGPSPAGIAEDHEAGMGIRFIYESAEERARVEGTVERMMIDNLGQLIYSKLMGRERGA